MRRRHFIAGLGLSAIAPRAAWGQQTANPVVGFLSPRSPDEAAGHVNAFRRGLEEMGFVEGRNVSIEYRWAKGDYSKLPSLASDLLSRPLSLIAAAGDPAALAAKEAGVAVPFIFIVGQDPVRADLVESMNRPGKATGVNFFTGDLSAKRLELLCSIAPAAQRVGLLHNPLFGVEHSDQFLQSASAAARSLGREAVAQAATTDAEIEAAFAAMIETRIGALVVQNDPFFDSRRNRIVALSSRHKLPGIFHIREFPADGGLMSYGASLSDTFRQFGVYAGKVLRGARPNDLPVLRPTKFEMVINVKTAKTLGLAVPQSILVQSDELIE